MIDQKDITDAYIKRSLTLLRAAEGEAVDVSKRLGKVHDKIIKEIENVFGSKPSNSKIMGLRTFIDARLSDFYKNELPKELKEIEVEVVTRETLHNESLLENVSNEKIVSVRSEKVMKAAAKKPYQGKTFNQHVGKAFKTERKRVLSVLNSGYKSGKSVQEMTRDVKAVTGRADRDVRTITRSFFMHNAVESKEAVYKINPDIVEAKIWVSTLDSRTTPLICGVRDGLLYDQNDEPIDHGLPWDGGPGRIHWNCRSTSVPKIKGVKFTAPRPSVGAGDNYKRGDNKTRTGRVRKPHKAAREKGIFEVNIKTTRTRYEGWLKEQSKHNIDFVSDVLGSKEKARAFRDGTETLSSLGALSPVANPLSKTQI